MTFPFLTARWQDLVAVNFEVPIELLHPLVPTGTELDLWEGKALVSLVAFRFLDTRVLGMPIPFHINFPEINLRFYVKRHVGNELRRGVVFVKEFVPRTAIALTARWLFEENYHAVAMSHGGNVSADGGALRYSWRASHREHSISATVSGALAELEAGSEVHFIFEHYWGYTRRENGTTSEYHVVHPPWRVWENATASIEADTVANYGPELGLVLQGRPRSIAVAEGSSVAVHFGTRLASQTAGNLR